MTEQEIRSTVTGILKRISPETDMTRIPDNASLRESLDLDSFDYLRFVMDINKALQVEIPESEYPQLMTMGGVVSYLAARCK
jgi:acyl carrier protein